MLPCFSFIYLITDKVCGWDILDTIEETKKYIGDLASETCLIWRMFIK